VRIYLFSIAAGMLVGIIYGVLNVRSPAPPVVALLGLLGILVGEQLAAAAKRSLAGKPVTAAWLKADCAEQILGSPIGRSAPQPDGDRRHERAIESSPS
jgi:XapX domain-containing protein